jgi:chemotaxis protein MotB
MPSTSNGRPIIIKRKKVVHAGHHGGAWKVAFADFMTAMMAFFLVMWILGLSESTRKGISGYFKEPGIFSFTAGKAMPMEIQTVPSIHKGDGSGETQKVRNALVKQANQKAEMKNVAARVQQVLAKLAQDDQKLAKIQESVKIEMTPDGLRLELAESSELAFFNLGGANANTITKKVLAMIAPELKKLGHPIEIEGHTDNRPYGGSAKYTNWELSADRANAARKILTEAGVAPEQITAVTGYADRRPRKQDAPQDISNRRVSIVVQYPKEDPRAEQGAKDSSAGTHSAPTVFLPISADELEGAYKQRE